MLRESSARAVQSKNGWKMNLTGNKSLTFNGFEEMKRICSFLFAAVAMISAVSCNKELQQEIAPAVQDAKSYTAYFQEDGTKAVLDGVKTLWQNNDALLVYDGMSCAKYVTSLNEPAPAADFVLADGETALSSETGVIAIYPEWADGYRNAEVSVAAQRISPVWMEKNQNATAGSYDPHTAIAMAYSEDSLFVFKNAASLLKFTVANDNVKTVTVYSNNGEPLAGLWTLVYNDGEPVAYPLEEEGATVNWVELNAGEGVFEVGKEYYISVFPQVLETGFTVEFSFAGPDGDKMKVKSYDESIEFNRNVILNLGTLEYDGPMPGWGIVGTLTSWGEELDIPMEKKNDSLYVASSVEFVTDGAFKIRKNNVWKDETNFGLKRAGTVVEADYVYSLVAGSGSGDAEILAGVYDIWFDLYNAKLYVMTPGTDITYAAVPDSELAPEYSEWYIVGSFNDWTVGDAEYLMEYDGENFVYYGLTLETAHALKFNAGSWDVERGGASDYFALSEDMYVWAGAGNINVPAGTYDVYLSADATTVRFEGEINTNPEPVLVEWYLVGSFNNWTTGDTEYQMQEVDGYYVFYDLVFDASYELKFNTGSWAVNRGGSFAVNQAMGVNQDGTNIVVPAGSYDVYLSKDASKAYFMTDGMTPDDAEIPEETWYLVGSFNGWTPGDVEYLMEYDGEYYVFHGFEAESGCELKFNAGDWSNNRGADSFAVGTGLNLFPDGKNIMVTAGTYDIYMNVNTDKAYFMPVGEYPEN